MYTSNFNNFALLFLYCYRVALVLKLISLETINVCLHSKHTYKLRVTADNNARFVLLNLE